MPKNEHGISGHPPIHPHPQGVCRLERSEAQSKDPRLPFAPGADTLTHSVRNGANSPYFSMEESTRGLRGSTQSSDPCRRCTQMLRPPIAFRKRYQEAFRATGIELCEAGALPKEVVEPRDLSQLGLRYPGEAHTLFRKGSLGYRLPDNQGHVGMALIKRDFLE